MERTLPYDIEAERATLGSGLINRDAMLAVDAWLTPAHFYLEQHAWVYEAMQTCYRANVPPDLATVSDALRRSGRLENIGGLSYLLELVSAAPTPVHAEYYGRIVERTAVHRRVIEAAGKIAALGFNEEQTLDQLATEATQALTQALTQANDGALVSMRAAADELYQAWQSPEEAGAGVSTGYTDIDQLLGGYMPGDLLVVAARPAVGKTSFALCTARKVAEFGPVLFFSQEMTRRQLLERMVAVETGINAQAVRLRRWEDDKDYQLAMQALAELSALPIHIDDTPALAITAMQRRAAQFVLKQGKPALILVDYLQLTTSPGNKNQNREQEVAAVSRGLKALAKLVDAPVLALAQLNREVEKRAAHIPVLSDLRESGQIEQDCDVVAFLHREELYDKDTDKKGMAELHVAKHRGGPLGTVPLQFDATTTAFRSLVRYGAMAGY